MFSFIILKCTVMGASGHKEAYLHVRHPNFDFLALLGLIGLSAMGSGDYATYTYRTSMVHSTSSRPEHSEKMY